MAKYIFEGFIIFVSNAYSTVAVYIQNDTERFPFFIRWSQDDPRMIPRGFKEGCNIISVVFDEWIELRKDDHLTASIFPHDSLGEKKVYEDNWKYNHYHLISFSVLHINISSKLFDYFVFQELY